MEQTVEYVWIDIINPYIRHDSVNRESNGQVFGEQNHVSQGKSLRVCQSLQHANLSKPIPRDA